MTFRMEVRRLFENRRQSLELFVYDYPWLRVRKTRHPSECLTSELQPKVDGPQ